MNSPRVIRESGLAVECPECGHSVPLYGAADIKSVRGPREVAEMMLPIMAAMEREELWVVLMDARNHVLGLEDVYKGNVSASLVNIGELFMPALRRGRVASVILVHNHPSGDVTPSPDDLHMTAEAIAAGRLLDMPVKDHIIIAGESWTSLRDRGVKFEVL